MFAASFLGCVHRVTMSLFPVFCVQAVTGTSVHTVTQTSFFVLCVQVVTGTSVRTVTQTSFFVLCVQAVTGTSAVRTVTQSSFFVCIVCAGRNRNISSSHSYSELILCIVCANLNRNISSSHSYSELIPCICVCRLEQEHQQCPGWLCLQKLLSTAPISISWNWLQRNIMLCSEYHFIFCHIKIHNMWHHLLISHPLLLEAVLSSVKLVYAGECPS